MRNGELGRVIAVEIRHTPEKDTRGLGTGSVSYATGLAESTLICEVKKQEPSQEGRGDPQWRDYNDWRN